MSVCVVDWASVEHTFAGDGTKGGGGALLLGNGFSSNIWPDFRYGSLLEESGLTGVARELFRDRVNFETVLAELSTACQVLAVARPDTDVATTLRATEAEVRDALVEAVSKVHPDAIRLQEGVETVGDHLIHGKPLNVLDKIVAYLPRYSRVFVTNYDLIAYWVAVRSGIADLFRGPDAFEEAQAESWMVSSPAPKILFMHGALHLWRSLANNAERKYTAENNSSLLDIIRSSVQHEDRVPLFISEGSSDEKAARIRTSPYLSYCMRVLQKTDKPLTVLGQSLGEVDKHISRAICQHPYRRVAVGVYVGDVNSPSRAAVLESRARELQGRLSPCRDVVFFDSAEHPLTEPSLCADSRSSRGA